MNTNIFNLLYQCEYCSADLSKGKKIKERIIKCSYCGNNNILPKEEQKENVLEYINFGKNKLLHGKFNEAYLDYKEASKIDPTEPEAYFGMALAEHKIRYVKDNKKERMQPICYKINKERFKDNKNYQKALQYATIEQKEEYQSRAEEIDAIKDEFFKLEQENLEYDCFFCAKNEDYGMVYPWYTNLLKNKKYKIYFAAVDNMGKEGSEYEAEILYALYKAKSMIIFCSNEEYLRTPWVMNEYQRYIEFMEEGIKKEDSLTFVFKEKVIEQLPLDNYKKKIQGISYNSTMAYSLAIGFIERNAKATTSIARTIIADFIDKNAKTNEEDFEIEVFEDGKTCSIEGYMGTSQIVNIPSIINGKGVTRIGYGAFSSCVSLTSIIISKSVTNIREGTFLGCSNLTSIVVEKGNPIYDSRNNCNAIIETSTNKLIVGCQNTIIPNSVTSIGDFAFSRCSSLTSIVIPESVIDIGWNAFNGCSSLASVEIPNSVTSIGSWAFSGCDSLTSIVIPNGVTTIRSRAFNDCSSLTSITIPNSVTWIDGSAFSDCSNLTSIVVEKNNSMYDSRDNCNAIIDTSTNTLIVGCQNTTIPNSVTWIGPFAFSGCSNLTSITIPKSVIGIGESAFSSCDSLTNIEIPNTVRVIEDSVFSSCRSLTSITIPNSVNWIGDFTFSKCSNLTSIEIPNSIKNMGEEAFSWCINLTSITIPKSVTSIGKYAFLGCISLASITIPKSVKHIKGSAFLGCDELRIYCEVRLRPIGWEKNWNSSNCSVTWGYKK